MNHDVGIRKKAITAVATAISSSSTHFIHSNPCPSGARPPSSSMCGMASSSASACGPGYGVAAGKSRRRAAAVRRQALRVRRRGRGAAPRHRQRRRRHHHVAELRVAAQVLERPRLGAAGPHVARVAQQSVLERPPDRRHAPLDRVRDPLVVLVNQVPDVRAARRVLAGRRQLRVLRPVRSSTNSRHDAGRCSGSALIARRMAQSIRSDRLGTTLRGGVRSLCIFFIQASSGPLDLNGSSPVTIM